MKIVFIGSGNVATHLAIAAKQKGHCILQVYSRSAENARYLAEKVNASYSDNISHINPSADIYIFSVKDDALGQVLAEMPETEGIWIHTAGSIPMNIFRHYHDRYGVLYPLQTFSKKREIDFEKIPLFIEANDSKVCEQLQEFAGGLSPLYTILKAKNVDICIWPQFLHAILSITCMQRLPNCLKKIKFLLMYCYRSSTKQQPKSINYIRVKHKPALRFVLTNK